MNTQANMATRYEREIPEGYEARIDGNNVIIELKESDDERIRKEIKHHISLTEFYRFMTASKEECLAYLEKQKELERIVPEREATDFEIEVHEIIAQARSDKRLADKDVLAQFEQAAACVLMWKAEKQKERGPLTNEEEYTLQRIIEHLEDEGCPQSWKDLLYDIYNLPYEKQKEQPSLPPQSGRGGVYL